MLQQRAHLSQKQIQLHSVKYNKETRFDQSAPRLGFDAMCGEIRISESSIVSFDCLKRAWFCFRFEIALRKAILALDDGLSYPLREYKRTSGYFSPWG